MADDPVLAALDAFIAGLATTENRQDRQEIDSTNKDKTTKATPRTPQETLREESRIDENLYTSGSEMQTSPLRDAVFDVACGFCGEAVEKIEFVTATSGFAQAKGECRWHLDHRERVPHAICAGCRGAIGTRQALDLADGNRVHVDAAWHCLIAWGRRWRSAARAALARPEGA